MKKQNIFEFIEAQPRGYVRDITEAVKEQLQNYEDPYQAVYQSIYRGKVWKSPLETTSRRLIVDWINALEWTNHRHQDFDWSPIK